MAMPAGLRQAAIGLVVGVVVLSLTGLPGVAMGQGQEAPRADAIRLFLDCSWCDTTFLRSDITFVNHVRDPKDADVHLMVTTRDTGGGGTEYTLEFIGLKAFADTATRLRYFAKESDSSDVTRRGLSQLIKLGLARYVAATPLASELKIVHERKSAAGAAAPARDPWNYWVYRASFSTYQSGERSQSGGSTSASISANRVTEAWKFTSRVSGSYGQSTYELGDGEQYVSITRNYSASTLLVKALSPHWSFGGHVSATSSTYRNQDFAMRAAPAIEYNIYPYSESTRRQLTFNYTVGVSHFNYDQETIFDRMAETRLDQAFNAYLDLRQPWGTSNTSFRFTHLLDDLGKNSTSVDHWMNVRLFKGFSFNAGGGVSRIHDQLYLPKRGASDEEILVRRRQLATSYSYFFMGGFSYTFGSIYNNVVNSRFDGSGLGSVGGTTISISY